VREQRGDFAGVGRREPGRDAVSFFPIVILTYGWQWWVITWSNKNVF
jgi:hypothetical protein